jgi:hypothetical protein
VEKPGLFLLLAWKAGINFSLKMGFLFRFLKFIIVGTIMYVSASAALVLFVYLLQTPPPPINISDLEIVMEQGDRISASKDSDAVDVVSDGDFKRSYTWKGCTLTSVLNGRYSRWFGSLGIYNAAPSFGIFSSQSKSCQGLNRTVVQEGQIHFPNEQFASEWLNRRPYSYITAWNSYGLVVSWTIVPSREQFSVDIWQMCMNGAAYVPLPPSGNVTISSSNGERRNARCARPTHDEIDKSVAQYRAHWQSADDLYSRRPDLKPSPQAR